MGWTFSSDMPSLCYAYPYVLHRLPRSKLLFANTGHNWNVLCRLFHQTNIHKAVAHPYGQGCITVGSESVHLELFILGKGWAAWARSRAGGKGSKHKPRHGQTTTANLPTIAENVLLNKKLYLEVTECQSFLCISPELEAQIFLKSTPRLVI